MVGTPPSLVALYYFTLKNPLYLVDVNEKRKESLFQVGHGLQLKGILGFQNIIFVEY